MRTREQHASGAWFPKAYADFVQRFRVLCGFLLLLAFAGLSQPSRRSMLIGLPVCALGLLLRASAAGHLAKDRELATTGPYAYIRNPLYAGTLIVAVGVVIASRNLWLAVIFALAFILIYLPAIELEEQHLDDVFPNYRDYRRRIHRFVPIARWDGDRRRFSWARYRRNQEYKALIGFLAAIAWLLWKYWRSGNLR